ncbi:c-type cytochrome [Neptunomonas antarctica]|uniref:c-type cytochrome n=1 Tax=Neptunomonas antarctica TaxID=619304 RepID=UPI00138F528B
MDVKIGALSESAQKGQLAFNHTCSECHGDNAEGSLKGPPLIHGIYNPGHHSNQSVISAVRKGVQQHHWPYGDMGLKQKLVFQKCLLF